eukprot:jgi/Chrzof1/1429/Cz10g07200.t1_PDAT
MHVPSPFGLTTPPYHSPPPIPNNKLVGESRETADLMTGIAFLVEKYLSKSSRAQVFRTWASLLAMLPVGGPGVWGNATWAPDDTQDIIDAGRSFGWVQHDACVLAFSTDIYSMPHPSAAPERDSAG